MRHDQAAQKARVHALVDVDVAVAGLDQAGAELLLLHVGERVRALDLGDHDAALLGDQGRERR